METPEYPPVKELRETVSNISFRVKTRGYDPKEVDAFLDVLVERLQSVENKLDDLRQYESWLRMEAHGQIIGQAQQEALRIMQEAQDNARALEEKTRADLDREQQSLRESIAQCTESWNEQRNALEKELEQARQYVKNYRNEFIRTMEDSIATLRQEQQYDDRETTHALSGLPTLSTPQMNTQVNSIEDVNKLIEELKRQLRK